MDKPVSIFHFKLMAFTFKLRDLFIRPEKILEEAGVKPGLHVLDYGCGPGSYSLAAAAMVGESGRVYALDIHPLAIGSVKKKAARKGLKNILAINSDCATGLDEESVDMVLLYDVLHEFSDPDKVLGELYRILKPGSVLSVRDHHLKEEEIVSKAVNQGLFKLVQRGKKTHSFLKAG